jgi:hypothetical protein
MQPIRQVFDDAPDFFPVPIELRHRKVEIIVWPLDDSTPEQAVRVKPKFNIADVESIEIPSREERNARR